MQYTKLSLLAASGLLAFASAQTYNLQLTETDEPGTCGESACYPEAACTVTVTDFNGCTGSADAFSGACNDRNYFLNDVTVSLCDTANVTIYYSEIDSSDSNRFPVGFNNVGGDQGGCVINTDLGCVLVEGPPPTTG